ncbi:MAG: hypothetical protein WAV40_02130 [Microgenomates group bacterium]
MHFIEPSPKNIITARLIENGYLTKKLHPSFMQSSVKRQSAPILPKNETIENLFDNTAPWWTYVNQEPYIPFKLLTSVIEPKESKWIDDGGYHSGVFKAQLLRKVRLNSRMVPKAMTHKQRFPFVEDIFARHVIDEIVIANQSQYLNVSKINYRLRPDVHKDELAEIYTKFLASLAIAYSRRKKQDWLRCYLER